MSSFLKPFLLCFALLSVFLLPAPAQEQAATESAPVSVSNPAAGKTVEDVLMPNRRFSDAALKKVYPDPRYPHWVMPKYPAPGCVRYDTGRGFAEVSGTDEAGAVYALLSLGLMAVMAWTIFKERTAAKDAGVKPVRRVWQPGGVWFFIMVSIYSGAMFWFMSPGFIVLPFVVFMARLTPENRVALPPSGFEQFCREYLIMGSLWCGLNSFAALFETETVDYEERVVETDEHGAIINETVVAKGQKTRTDISARGIFGGSLFLLSFYFLCPLIIMLYTFAKFQRNYMKHD